jgi:hypothetical protein
MQGDFGVESVAVDTVMALVPPGSRLSISVQVTPVDADSKVQTVKLQGLPAGGQISDGSGNTGGGNVEISQWNMDSIQAKLPANQKTNLAISVVATVAGPDGDTASASAAKSLNLSP